MSLTTTATSAGFRWLLIPATIGKMIALRKNYKSHAAGAMMILAGLAGFWVAPESSDAELMSAQAMAALFSVLMGIAVICLRLGLTGVATFIIDTLLKEMARTQEQIAEVKEFSIEATIAATAAKDQATLAKESARVATKAAETSVPLTQAAEIATAAVALSQESLPQYKEKPLSKGPNPLKTKPAGSGRQ